jgi:hypothetical protein
MIKDLGMRHTEEIYQRIDQSLVRDIEASGLSFFRRRARPLDNLELR